MYLEGDDAESVVDIPENRTSLPSGGGGHTTDIIENKEIESDGEEYTQSELEVICQAEEDHRLGVRFEEGSAASNSKEADERM